MNDESNTETPQSPQGTLVEMPPQPPIPSVLRNGFTPVNFVKVHADRGEDDEACISFEISFQLVEEMKEKNWLPTWILNAWSFLRDQECKAVSRNAIPECNCVFASVPDGSDVVLSENSCGVTHVSVSYIEQKGTGETKKITRLTCRIELSDTEDVWEFARAFYGRSIWFQWVESNRKLNFG